jgi:hypothetical protein
MHQQTTEKYDKQVMGVPEHFEIFSTNGFQGRGDHQEESNGNHLTCPTRPTQQGQILCRNRQGLGHDQIIKVMGNYMYDCPKHNGISNPDMERNVLVKGNNATQKGLSQIRNAIPAYCKQQQRTVQINDIGSTSRSRQAMIQNGPKGS